MLNRYLEAKAATPATAQLIEKYQGEKPIHKYTKAELEKWINKEADINRLSKLPISNAMFNNNLKEVNDFLQEYGDVNKYYVNPAIGFMNVFFNRDYKTIGEQFKKDLKYYIKSTQTYKGVEYSTMRNLPKYFDVLVQDIKKEKQISESIFISDKSLYFKHEVKGDSRSYDRIRGTQYIRYTSGPVPKDIQLNKWYKRDVDVQLRNYAVNGNGTVKWNTSPWAYDGIYPITSFVEVKK